MIELTTAERRVFDRLCTPEGGLLIVAADQRAGMKAMMVETAGDAGSVSTAELAAAKADIALVLGGSAPAVLLDPEVALPFVIDNGILSATTGLVIGLDASGYETAKGLRRTRYVEGMSARRVRELGGDAAKMLFYLRADRLSDESAVITDMARLIAEYASEGVLLIVEVLTYQLEQESDTQYAAAFPALIIGATRLCAEAGARVLKLPYPGSADACAAVTAAAAGIPWAVLSAGVNHDTFIQQVRIAVAAGAHGAMAGRSLWKDCLTGTADDRRRALTGRAVPRVRELARVIDETRSNFIGVEPTAYNSPAGLI